MKIFKFIFSLSASLLLTAGLLFPTKIYAQSADFKALKSLDIYYSVLRELSLFYVDSVQIDQLVDESIHSMLKELDPYTIYMPEDLAEDFDIITTGRYGGIGSLIKKVPNGIEISEPYKGFPADRAGLVAGDIILEIDGESTFDMDATLASKKMKGIAGTKVSFKILKLRTKETVSLDIIREQIHISDVTFGSILGNGVGFIHLSSFSANGSRDFRNTFTALKKQGMTRLILDLRSNDGGLIDEAVNIVGCFVPRGSTVVTSRGRVQGFDMSYKTKEEPLDVHIPIAVLVNNNSASASEIVAGALQDFDRALILGTRTFGKGLIQTVRGLGYNAQLKITTAKYYIPSGRCVQAIDYSHRNEDGGVEYVPDSLRKEFQTKGGRKVYDGGGITPDIVIEPETYERIVYSALSRDLIHDFSLQYYIKHEHIAAPEDFELSDSDYESFTQFMADKPFDDKTNSEIILERLILAINDEHLGESTKDEIALLEKKINHDRESKLRRFKNEFKPMIEQEIVARYYYQEGRLRAIIRHDSQVKKAVEIMSNNDTYFEALSL